MAKKEKIHHSLGNLLMALFLIAIGLFALILSQNYSPRAKLMPQVVSFLLVVMSIVEIAKNKDKFSEIGRMWEAENRVEVLKINDLKRTIAAILLYPILLHFIGFIAASILLIGYLMYVKKVAGPMKIASISIITSVAVYYIFDTLAGVRFPEGPWGF